MFSAHESSTSAYPQKQRSQRHSTGGIRAVLSAGRTREVVTLIDLSASGAGVTAPRLRSEVGAEVTLRFDLPVAGGTYVRVEVRGEVRHSRRLGKDTYGVRFLRLNYDAQKTISAYMSR